MEHKDFKVIDEDSGFYLHLKHSKGVFKEQQSLISCQRTYTVYVLINGYQLVSLSKGDFVMKSGDIFLINKCTYYESLIHRGNTEYLTINFDIQDNFPIFNQDYENLKEIFKSKTPFVRLNDLAFANFINDFLQIFNEHNQYPDTYNLKALLKFIDWLFVIYDGFKNQNYYFNDLNTQEISTLSLILKTKKYIQEHFKNDLSLKILSENVNLSPSYLSRQFKEMVDETITQYITNIRLDFSYHLLEITNLNIAEICYESGFNSISQFNKCFKKRFGSTPSNIRKSRAAPKSSR